MQKLRELWDTLSAIGIILLFAISWVAIPIAGLILGVTLAFYILFEIVRSYFHEDP